MKNKLYNVIFPIWLLIFFPPIIFIVIPGNFIIDFIMLLIILKILKFTDIKKIFKKNYLKVVGFGFLADIIGAFLLFLSVFISPIDNISWNPYQNILSSIYLIIVFLISTYLIYLFNYKFNFKDDQRKKISFLLAILTAPYLFLVPTSIFYNQPLTIYNYDETSITSTNKMNKIFNYLENEYEFSKTEIDTNKKIVTISIEKNDNNSNYYATIEKYASLLFALTTDLNKVIIEINDLTYTFEYNEINKIYNNNVRNIEINKIYMRYSHELFNNAIYLGNINGSYDLFKKTEENTNELNEIYSDDYYKYLVSCKETDQLIVLKDDKEILLTEALKNNLFNINSISTTTLKIYKEAK